MRGIADLPIAMGVLRVSMVHLKLCLIGSRMWSSELRCILVSNSGENAAVEEIVLVSLLATMTVAKLRLSMMGRSVRRLKDGVRLWRLLARVIYSRILRNGIRLLFIEHLERVTF